MGISHKKYHPLVISVIGTYESAVGYCVKVADMSGKDIVLSTVGFLKAQNVM